MNTNLPHYKAYIKEDNQIYDVLSVHARFADEDFIRCFINKVDVPGIPKNHRMTDGNVLLHPVYLTDAEGTPLYNGDILEHTYDKKLFKWLIEFDGYRFSIVNIGVDGYLGERFAVTHTQFTDRIKVGNSYTNPELLK